MDNEKRYFTMCYNGRCTKIEVAPWTTLEIAWLSQKCWFTSGAVVVITDDKGNSKIFIKE